MARLDKLLARLASKPNDFSWDELCSLMSFLGYQLKTSGGSGRKFYDPASTAKLFMHQPHPSNILKAYQVRDTLIFLKQEGHMQ